MLYITDHPNDRDLHAFLPDAEIIHLEWGDVTWQGVWTGGAAVSVCGERKRTRDLLNSIRDGRHLKQVTEARQAGYDHIFLIWEQHPITKQGPDGLVHVKRGKGWDVARPQTHQNQLDGYLFQLQLYAGVRVLNSKNPRETARLIRNLHRLYQTPPEEHVSLKRIYEAPPPAVSLVPPSVTVRMYKELRGVGYERAHALAEVFPKMCNLVSAGPDLIAEVEGVGPKTAMSIVKELGT